MLELFVGDIYEDLAQQATAHNANALLITSDNYKDFLHKSSAVGYTSLADIGDHEQFFQLCHAVDQIYYCPPTAWSHPDQQTYTEHVLAWVSQYRHIHGYDHLLAKNQALSQDFVQDTRKTDQPQLWIAGCSITYGVGVELDQTYRHIVSQQLGLEHSNLSWPSSSIIWQSDQICGADIRPNDVVFWGLTSTHRIPVWHKDKVMHLNSRQYEKYPELIKKFPIDLLDNPTLSYHNVLAVRRAYNFCKKAGAKLVALILLPDFENLFLHYNVPVLKYLRPTHHEFVDLGTDNIHPGPEQHKIFAKEFLKLYNQLY
jgi:hypothetical protein